MANYFNRTSAWLDTLQHQTAVNSGFKYNPERPGDFDGGAYVRSLGVRAVMLVPHMAEALVRAVASEPDDLS